MEPEYSTDHLSLNARCSINDCDEKRGRVAYIGPIATLKPGTWVGVELDEPVGRHDGTLDGKVYFECGQPGNYGVFCRPDKVRVGDFPRLLDEELMDDEF